MEYFCDVFVSQTFDLLFMQWKHKNIFLFFKDYKRL